jgi:predicted RND superfamily exporter protein
MTKGGWRRFLPLLLLVAAGLAAIPFAGRVVVANGNSSWIDAQGPSAIALAQVEARFGRQDGFVIMVSAADVLDGPVVAWQRRIGEAVSALPGVAGIDSLATVRDVQLDEGEPVPVALLAQPRGRILAHPLYRNLLIAADGRAAGILVRLATTLDADAGIELEGRLRQLLVSMPPPAGAEAVLGGLMCQQQAINRAVAADQSLTVPLSLVLLAVVLLSVLRDLRLAALALVAVGGALAWTFAALALAGRPVDAILGLLPPLVMGIGVATSLHLSFAMAEAVSSGDPRPGRAALRRTFMPLLLATFTTMAGIGGLWWGAVPAVRDFALWGALAVLLAAVWPFLLLLAAAPLVPPAVWTRLQDGWAGRRLGGILGRTAGGCVRHRRWVLAIYAVAIIAGLLACSRLRVDADFVHALPESDPVRQAHAAIDRKLTGTLACDVLIDPGHAPTAADLAALAKLTTTLRADPGFVHVLSLADAVDLVRGGSARDAVAVAADLRLFAREVHERFVGTALVSGPGATLRLQARQSDGSVADASAAARRAEAAARAAFPGATVAVASGALLLDETTGRIVPAIAQGLVISLAANVILLLVFLRRSWLALAALPLAGLPLLFTYAALPVLEWPLDVGISMIACVALGIIMDDAIHMAYALHRYDDPAEAARNIGPVLTAACLALSVAFSACAFGGFSYTRRFGVLLAAAFIVGLIVNLTLAPAILRKERKP